MIHENAGSSRHRPCPIKEADLAERPYRPQAVPPRGRFGFRKAVKQDRETEVLYLL